MSAASTAARPYLRHASLYGVHCVFLTAAQDGIGAAALAELAEGLRKVQTARRKDWQFGVPMTFDRHGRKGAAPTVWQEPKGILEPSARRALVRACLQDGLAPKLIAAKVGVPQAVVREIRAELDAERCDHATGFGSSIAPPARTCEITSMPASSESLVGCLPGTAWPITSNSTQTQEVPAVSEQPQSLPKFRVQIPGKLSLSGGGIEMPQTFEVHAIDANAAKARVRQDLGVKRLPAGVTVETVAEDEPATPTATPEPEGAVETAVQETVAKASEPSWKDLPAAEKAEYLLGKTTIPDRSWTEEQRLPKEKRAAFIRRVLLGETESE